MHRLKITAFIAAALAVWLSGSQAFASTIPPGNSAADQYAESFPGPSGNETAAVPHPKTPSQVLGASTAARFQQAGASARAASELAATTAPAVARHRPSPGTSPGSTSSSQGRAGGSGDPATEIAKNAVGVSGTNGMGILLPLLLLLTFAGAVVVAVRGHKASRS